MIPQELVEYIETNVIFKCHQLDTSHDTTHVRQVIANSFQIIQELKDASIDERMVYVVAAYHDLGLLAGRAGHEQRSKELLLADKGLSRWFSAAELQMMGEAVADHRASSSHEPRSIYGKIVSEADRDIDFWRILRRTYVYAIEKKQLRHPQVLADEAYDYLTKKYGCDSGLVFWLEYSRNRKNLQELQAFLQNPEEFASACQEVYKKLQQAGFLDQAAKPCTSLE